MIVMKIVALYLLLGAQIGIVPLLDPSVRQAINQAKEQFGVGNTLVLMITSAIVTTLFWPLFIFGHKK